MLLKGLVGAWTGNSRLVQQGHPVRESASELVVTPVARGKFARLDYTWADGPAPQEGSVLLGFEKARGVATAAWVDSWHMGDKVMTCEGEMKEDGGVAVTGAYAAPPGKDWGWRIEVGPGAPEGSLVMRMFNISPEGREELAVEALYRRTGRATSNIEH